MSIITDYNKNTKMEKQYQDKFGRFALRGSIPQHKPTQWKEAKFIPGPGHELKDMRLPEESTRIKLYKEHFYAFAYE